jgi:hypothetical protein
MKAKKSSGAFSAPLLLSVDALVGPASSADVQSYGVHDVHKPTTLLA